MFFFTQLFLRKQFVSIWNNSSALLNTSCGVPQDSVFGHLLFLLCINDIQSDDSNLFYADKSLTTLETTVNNQILYVHQWFLCKQLISYCGRVQLYYIPCIQLEINSSEICHLNWKAHALMLRCSNGATSKIGHFVNGDIFKNLYSSLVYQLLMYGLVVWRNTYGSSLNLLLLLQKKLLN